MPFERSTIVQLKRTKLLSKRRQPLSVPRGVQHRGRSKTHVLVGRLWPLNKGSNDAFSGPGPGRVVYSYGL